MANEYRVSSVAIEVLSDGAALARVSSVAIEVLRSVSVVAASARRRQLVN